MLEILFLIYRIVFITITVSVPIVLLYISTNGIQKMIDAKKAGNRIQSIWIAEAIIFGLLFILVIVFYINIYINIINTPPSVM